MSSYLKFTDIDPGMKDMIPKTVEKLQLGLMETLFRNSNIYESLLVADKQITEKLNINPCKIYEFSGKTTPDIVVYIAQLAFQYYPYIFKTRPETHAVLRALFYLIVEKNVNYNKTRAMKIIEMCHKYGKQDRIVQNITLSAYYLVRDGPRGFVNKQRIIRRWYLKRKLAVRKIENVWFKIINSPYTSPGMKMLTIREHAFKMKYFSS